MSFLYIRDGSDVSLSVVRLHRSGIVSSPWKEARSQRRSTAGRAAARLTHVGARPWPLNGLHNDSRAHPHFAFTLGGGHVYGPSGFIAHVPASLENEARGASCHAPACSLVAAARWSAVSIAGAAEPKRRSWRDPALLRQRRAWRT